MLDKIKKILSIIGSGLLYIVAPLAILVAYIIHLKNQVTSLTDNLVKNKAEAELAKILAKKIEEENETNKDELEYNALRDSYLKQLSNSPNTKTLPERFADLVKKLPKS